MASYFNYVNSAGTAKSILACDYDPGSPRISFVGLDGNVHYIKILPLKNEHMLTYSRLNINEVQKHKDPSDHVIIAHAITENLPLISSDTHFDFYRSQGLDLIFNKK